MVKNAYILNIDRLFEFVYTLIADCTSFIYNYFTRGFGGAIADETGFEFMKLKTAGSFKKGHIGYKANLGRKWSEEMKERIRQTLIRKSIKPKIRFIGKGEKSPRWTGDKIKYGGIHQWLRNKFEKSNKCENTNCEKKSNHYHWALLKGKKCERKRENFWILCVSCHMKYDGVLPNKGNFKKGIPPLKHKEKCQCFRCSLIPPVRPSRPT